MSNESLSESVKVAQTAHRRTIEAISQTSCITKVNVALLSKPNLKEAFIEH